MFRLLSRETLGSARFRLNAGIAQVAHVLAAPDLRVMRRGLGWARANQGERIGRERSLCAYLLTGPIRAPNYLNESFGDEARSVPPRANLGNARFSRIGGQANSPRLGRLTLRLDFRFRAVSSPAEGRPAR